MLLSAIKTSRKSGKEIFKYHDIELNVSLNDFWSWAYSDLIGNTERGILAEFLVAIAINSHRKISVSWNKFDLETPDGIAVEVKSSSYIQSWEQSKYSSPTFNIRQTLGWDSVTNVYDKEMKRQSGVYVFCVLKHKDQATIDPMIIEMK